MTDSKAKSKEVADDHDENGDQEYVPEDIEDDVNEDVQEPDQEEVTEVLENKEVTNEQPTTDDEEQEAEVEEFNDPDGDNDEDLESEVSIEDDDDEQVEPRGKKRENADESQSGPNKKQKESTSEGSTAETLETNGAAATGKVGSKHDDPRDPDTQGSAERLPEVGQQVEWKALPGFVDGEVVEILREAKDVEGKTVKAGENDPRLVLKSNKSGKICVHKPEAVYFK